MKTSVIEVHDMLSVLSVVGVEKRIGEVLGVESVTVNFAAGSATVRYDETRLNLADIKSDVRQSGYESDAPTGPSKGGGHKAHKAPDEAAGTPPATAGAGSAGTAQPDKTAPLTPQKPSPLASAADTTSSVPKSGPDAATGVPVTPTPEGDKQDKATPEKN